eukprot:gene4134-4426_t
MTSKVETLKHVSRYLLIKTILDGRWDEACTIVYNDETYARIEDNKHYLPIHLAIKLGCTTRLVQLLLTAYPESVRIKDPDDNYPLHLAASHHKGRLWVNMNELSLLLFNAFPPAMKEFDRNGNLPLHLALKNKGPDEMIQYYLSVFPDSVKILDAKGNTPLQLAIQFEGSYRIIFEVLRLYPEAIQIPNRNGAYPLHKVAFFNCSMEIFEMILNADPTISRKQDNNGNLPFHLACLNAGGPPNEAKLRLWMSHNPTCLSVRNKQGNIPFMMFQRPQDHHIEDYM